MKESVCSYHAFSRFVSFAIAIPALLSLLVVSQDVEAKVIYTPVSVTINGNGSIKINLNHDGINDFTVLSVTRTVTCVPISAAFNGTLTVTPGTGNAVVAVGTNAAELSGGAVISANQTFYSGPALMTKVTIGNGAPPCGTQSSSLGSWCHLTITYPKHCTSSGYLGLAFNINGLTHYGWAHIGVAAKIGTMTTTLTGFAYETTAGRAITAGQTFSTDVAGYDARPTQTNPELKTTAVQQTEALLFPMQYPLSSSSGFAVEDTVWFSQRSRDIPILKQAKPSTLSCNKRC